MGSDILCRKSFDEGVQLFLPRLSQIRIQQCPLYARSIPHPANRRKHMQDLKVSAELLGELQRNIYRVNGASGKICWDENIFWLKKCKSIRIRGLAENQDRNRCIANDMLSRAAQEEVLQTFKTMCSHDDHASK